MFKKETLYEMIDWAIQAAENRPIHVIVRSQAEGLTRFANSEIHQNVFEDRTDVQIVLLDEKKRSTVSTNKITKEGIEQAVKEAIENLSFLPEGDAPPALVDSPDLMEMDRFEPTLEEAFDEEKRAVLLGQELDKIILPYKAFGQISYKENSMVIGNSTGIRRFFRGNSVNLSVLISHDDGASGFASGVANAPAELDIAQVFTKAYDKAKMNHNPETIPIGAYTVVLEPQAVFNLMMYTTLLGFSAKNLQQKMSFLTDRLGEKVFDEKITIKDDWQSEAAPGMPFDMEGTPRTQLTLIENGVAKEVAYDSESAAKEGKKSTGHSAGMGFFGGAIPTNLVMKTGEKTLEQIIAETENGLLVTRFHYMNPVNPRQVLLTGLTRDGFYKIENGKITGAVANMRMTESMLKAFNQVAEISSDTERISAFFANVQIPAMKIENFHFTGQTSIREPGQT